MPLCLAMLISSATLPFDSVETTNFFFIMPMPSTESGHGRSLCQRCVNSHTPTSPGCLRSRFLSSISNASLCRSSIRVHGSSRLRTRAICGWYSPRQSSAKLVQSVSRPYFLPSLGRSSIRLPRQSTTVPNTSKMQTLRSLISLGISFLTWFGNTIRLPARTARRDAGGLLQTRSTRNIMTRSGAGLSWITVLRKREHYRKVYDGFDPAKIARYTPAKLEELLEDPGIIRHKGKIDASVSNAKAYLALVEREGSFAKFLWRFVGGKPKKNHPKSLKEVPAKSPESDAMSK